MHKAFLLLKVLLLLSAFIGTGSSHTAKLDHFGFLDLTGFDLTANSEQSSPNDNGNLESRNLYLQFLVFVSDVPRHYSSILFQRIASKPFACGPPAHLSA